MAVEGGGKGKGYGGSGGDWGKGGKGTFQPRAPGAPPPFFDGDCNHCHAHGHRKRDSPVLDKEMAARRAQAAGGNTGAASQSTGRAMEVSADAWYTRNAATSTFPSRPAGMFSLFPEAFGHAGDTDSEEEFPMLSTAPAARKRMDRPSVESWIPEGDEMKMDKIELLMDERLNEAILDIGDAVKVVEGKGKFGRKSARRYMRRELRRRKEAEDHAAINEEMCRVSECKENSCNIVSCNKVSYVSSTPGSLGEAPKAVGVGARQNNSCKYESANVECANSAFPEDQPQLVNSAPHVSAPPEATVVRPWSKRGLKSKPRFGAMCSCSTQCELVGERERSI